MFQFDNVRVIIAYFNRISPKGINTLGICKFGKYKTDVVEITIFIHGTSK
jgi:hypothetical protein